MRRGGLVVIEGPAGIGKSRLLEALRRGRHAGRRPRPRRPRRHLERKFADGVVRHLFEPVLADPSDRERLLTGGRRVGRPGVRPGGGAADRGRRVVSRSSTGCTGWRPTSPGTAGCCLVVDDLHWCDRPSLRFVVSAAPRLEGTATMLAVALRTAERGTDPPLVDELVPAPAAIGVRPQPRSARGVAQLVEERLQAAPEPAFTDACLKATGGNPLLLRQLLTSLKDGGVPPEASRGRLRQRPRSLSYRGSAGGDDH